MISKLYSALEATQLYGSFLRHRVWVAKMIRSAHLLYCFPLGSLALVWFFLPIFMFTLGFFALFPPESFTKNLGIVLISYGAFFIATGPISARTISDMFAWYFAGFASLLGNTAPVEAVQKETECALAKWNAEYA